MKRCTTCNEIKTFDCFYVSRISSAGSTIYVPSCKQCESKKAKRKWNSLSEEEKKNWSKRSNSNKEYHKNYRLQTKYNLTLQEFKQMYDDQQGCCYICETSVPNDQIRVDHDHSTGKVRKLLCHHCNVILGHARENPEVLTKCVEYINDFVQENKMEKSVKLRE